MVETKIEEIKQKTLIELVLERAFNNQGLYGTIAVIALCIAFSFAVMIMGTAFVITTLKITGLL